MGAATATKTRKKKRKKPASLKGRFRVPPEQLKFVRGLIRSYMKEHEIHTQAEFAKRADMRYARVNSLLLLRARALTGVDLEKLSKVLGVSEGELIGASDEPPKEQTIDLRHLANDGTDGDDEDETPVIIHLSTGKATLRIELRI